jgi:hypothetical protein
VNLIKSLIRTDCTFTVLIMSRGLVKGRILSKRGKRLVAHIANLEERCVQELVGKPEGKRLLARPRPRWEDNTQMGPRKLGEGDGLNRCGSG